MAGKIKAIDENLRYCCSVMIAPLAYIIRKTKLVKIYGYPNYATPKDKMIARILQLPPDKNKILLESDFQSSRVHTAEYEIDNRSVDDILDQICKDTDLYSYANSIS